MGDPQGFIKVKRRESGYRPVEQRVRDYFEVEMQLPEEERKAQASRCMDCGVPFCHWGCPLANIMPEWQEMIHRGNWKAAYEILEETNCFPEFTGRVCPAPCESSCVLGINDESVTIRQNELAVAEKAFELGLVRPVPPARRLDKSVAVIGSGPAGLACAARLNKAGYRVTVFEAEEAVGGYLRFGIPDFKLDKRIIDRRVNILIQEGIVIRTGTHVGRDITIGEIRKNFDAVCIAFGARRARDLKIEGRELGGIHFAMEYLAQQNRIVKGDKISQEELIAALNKRVLVIGGGDTGSDCVGTAIRQGAQYVNQVEVLPEPPRQRTEKEPWPLWPKLMKTSSSHEEGCSRMWSILTKKFIGDHGRVKGVLAVRTEMEKDPSGMVRPVEVPGTEFEMEADLVLLAMGFEHIIQEGLVSDLGLKLDPRGNIAINAHNMTSIEGIFAAGDAFRGASLVVWAISDGIKTARAIEQYLGR